MKSDPSWSLARWVDTLEYDHIPPRPREAVKDLLVDAVACALAGSSGEETDQVQTFTRAIDGGGQTTVIGSPETRSILAATVMNAYLVTAVTVCDVYTPAHCHMTPEIVPPALAIAQRDRLTGRQLLTSLAAGLEVATRVARGLHYPAFRSRGWHAPGIVGPFGAAAAVGKLLGLDADRLHMAFGLAGSQAAGTWAAWGTPTVKFHQARGAASGLLAGMLAEQHFRAAEQILTAPDGGVYPTYSDGGDPKTLVADLGEHWELEEISLRLWPGGTPLQPVITGLLSLLEEHGVNVDDVEQVRVHVAPRVYDAHARFVEPEGTFEALLSVHFAVAILLTERRLWLDQVGPSRYRDSDVRRVMRDRVQLLPDDRLTPDASRVELCRRGGGTVVRTVDAAKGHPRNPVTRDELAAKFVHCARGLDEGLVRDLLMTLWSLEDLEDTGDLLRMLSTGP